MTLFTASIIRLFAAFVIGGVIGFERTRHGRAAGIRTHMLVCIGAALTVLVGLYVKEEYPDFVGDMFRIPAQVISGIGFLGAGIILLRREVVIGLTTAAGIWTTAIIGIVLGYGFYVGAFVAAAFIILINTIIARVEKKEIWFTVFYAEIDDISLTNQIIDEIRRKRPETIGFRTVSAKSKVVGNLGIEIKVGNVHDEDMDIVREIKHVVYVSHD